ncbi:hypothetical protein [Aquamicrobium sp. LC103]|uniref:hypothetical protein n=1 Tax=Aquamicrobium sp. LC103 TaxID=1120658 RepID=UPI00063ED1AB|nr:hypothetical protein [Aquamicrobium sp. LC103]TKT79999.1 hypothetical protein XW59_006460 [Aquamicrobium sp. LC103]
MSMTDPKSFLPDYSALNISGRYRPAFKLFAGENWRFVRKDGKPVECDTAGQAIEAAKECVKRILNPEIRAEQIEAPVNDALADEVQAFLARREQEVAEERAKFGAMSTVFTRSGKQVPVEVKRRRA